MKPSSLRTAFHCRLLLLALLVGNANSFQSPNPLAYRHVVGISLRKVIDDRGTQGSSTYSKRQILLSTEADVDNIFGVEIESPSLQLTNNATFIPPATTNASGVLTSTEIKLYPDTPTFRECLAFTLPALGIYVCSPLMSLIDASFVGRASSLELAALGPASSISDSAPLPLLFLSIASTNLIAKYYAEGDRDSSARVSRTAIGAGGICGVVLAALLYCTAGPISALYCGGSSAAASLAPACAKYVSIRALALPAVVVTTIAQAVCIGTKDTKTPMISVALAGMLNLLGDFILVKWLGRGIAGAAWATSVSQVLSAGLLLRVLKKRGFLQRAKDRDDGNGNTIATVKQLLKFIPFLFVMAVKIGWHNSCSATAASLGGVRAAAHTAVVSVAMLCMVLGDVGSSLSQAFLPPFASTDTKSGKTTFDVDAAMPTIKQMLKCTLSISTTVMCLATLIIGVFGGQITSDPQVLAEMRRTLPWIVATLSFHGSAVTLEGVLLSRQKFRGLTINYSILAVTVAAFQLATRRFNLGLAGVWGCYLWFCSSRVVTFSALGGLLRPHRWLASPGQRFRHRSQSHGHKA
mmetsp:Transcript_3754/g.9574  ORF Transcript_3754/g.9574 Transcript_3754/m.9574 type:complete len:579 (+) Transcript_3754:210-1946(+)